MVKAGFRLGKSGSLLITYKRGIMLHRKKGISPLIASVLLIAFTMAIAGIMATWATTFSRARLADTDIEAECVGALDISQLVFNSDGTVSVKISNVSNRINLTGLKAIVEYEDTTRNKQYPLANYNVSDPLTPASVAFFSVNTNSTDKPKQLEVMSSNCPKQSALLQFK